ncbi:MAG: tRNA lysidine(34) synthetase TilS [Verrucomicrobiota bacterium]
MNKWVHEVGQSIQRRNLLCRGQSVLVAVSGGLDSMVLLHLLGALSETYSWKIVVAHFNHQLRGRSSGADERLVQKTSRKLKLRFVTGHGDVKKLARANRLSIEMAARKLRHEFLARVAKKLGIKTIALAHHADDQVELFFVRLFRGAGIDGLAGMKWKSPSPVDSTLELVRPLLNQPKKLLCEYAKSEKIHFREDISNASIDFQRNRIRHELIPFLKKHYQPALERTTLRVMEILGAESSRAKSATLDWWSSKSKPSFSNLSIALQRRSLRLQLLAQNVSTNFKLIESLRAKEGQFIEVGAEFSVARDSEGQVQVRKSKTAGFKSVPPGKFHLSKLRGEILYQGTKVQWAILRKRGDQVLRTSNCLFFDADKIGPKITLRLWQAGDKFQPIGMAAPVKLQNLFTNLKIPKTERHERIVATQARGEIFWVEGLRISEGFKLDNKSSRRLKWQWQRL